MILVDANLLLYAEDQQSLFNEPARKWWDAQLFRASPVCLCWTVINAFIRIGTNPRVFEHPLSIHQSISRVQSWLDQPCARSFSRPAGIGSFFKKCCPLSEGQDAANLVTGAHLAALASEHGCVLMSTDTDFSRFPGIKWRNPLK